AGPESDEVLPSGGKGLPARSGKERVVANDSRASQRVSPGRPAHGEVSRCARNRFTDQSFANEPGPSGLDCLAATGPELKTSLAGTCVGVGRIGERGDVGATRKKVHHAPKIAQVTAQFCQPFRSPGYSIHCTSSRATYSSASRSPS